jgi:osmotically-inducible protein OsmY
MKLDRSLKLVPGVLLGLALAGPAFAQTAGQSMHEAWHSTENAASHAWHGTKTAVKDTDITTKVKLALHNDKLTKGQDIHVETTEGVVTLTGHTSPAVAHQAVRLTRATTGVVGVNDDLRSTERMTERDRDLNR